MGFKTWEEMDEIEQLQLIFWDMYKDAYGVRPRHIDTTDWNKDMFLTQFETLGKRIDEDNARMILDQQQAAFDFEMRMQSLQSCGAKDRAMALRWVHEAEGSDGDDEYLCYLIGLPYGYFKVGQEEVSTV